MFRTVEAIEQKVGTAGSRSCFGLVALLPRPEAQVEHHVHAEFETSWPKQVDLFGDRSCMTLEQVRGRISPVEADHPLVVTEADRGKASLQSLCKGGLTDAEEAVDEVRRGHGCNWHEECVSAM